MGSQAPMTSSFSLEMMEKMEKDEEKKVTKPTHALIHTYIIGTEAFGCLGYFTSFKKNPEESPQGPTKISAYPS